MRLVLDTNVVVSGLLWHGIPRQLLDRSIDDETIELYSGPTLIDELANTPRYTKFAKRIALYATSADVLITYYEALVTPVSPTQISRTVPKDPDDDHVLACAVAAQAEFIASGDRHLLGLKQYQDISIVTAALDIFNKLRIAELLGMLQFILPERKRLNQYAGIRQDIECNVGHLERGLHAFSVFFSQDYGDIRVALLPVRVSRATTEQDGVINAVVFGDKT